MIDLNTSRLLRWLCDALWPVLATQRVASVQLHRRYSLLHSCVTV